MNCRPKGPDLLRRFTAAPLIAHFCLGRTKIQLDTNDPEILAASSDLVDANDGGTEKSFAFWKLIRDSDVACHLQPTIIETDDLRVLLSGNGTMIAVDSSRGEALGFLAPDANTEELRTVIFPFMAGVDRH